MLVKAANVLRPNPWQTSLSPGRITRYSKQNFLICITNLFHFQKISFSFRCLAYGGRDGLWWLSSPGTGCPLFGLFSGCWQFSLNMKLLIWWILFLYWYTSLGYFCPQTLFWKHGLDKLPSTSLISDLHTKVGKITRSVSGLATCDIWSRGWTT